MSKEFSWTIIQCVVKPLALAVGSVKHARENPPHPIFRKP